MARKSVADEVAARELTLYTINDGGLWGPDRTMGSLIRHNLIKKFLNGTLNERLVPKAFEHLMDAAAKSYAKEYDDSKNWNTIFTKATRTLAAEEISTHFLADIDNWARDYDN